MMFKTHLALGFLIALVSLMLLHPAYPYLFVPLATILSGLPDIDTEKSKFGRKIYPVSLFLRVVFGHRGLFHSLLAAFGIYFLFWYLKYPWIGLAALVGYLAHLVGDALTLEGIDPFYPFTKWRISGFMKTGGFLESVVFVFLIALNLFVCLKVLNIL